MSLYQNVPPDLGGTFWLRSKCPSNYGESKVKMSLQMEGHFDSVDLCGGVSWPPVWGGGSWPRGSVDWKSFLGSGLMSRKLWLLYVLRCHFLECKNTQKRVVKQLLFIVHIPSRILSWKSMNFYVYPWIFMVRSMDFYDSSWRIVNIHEYSWKSMRLKRNIFFWWISMKVRGQTLPQFWGLWWLLVDFQDFYYHTQERFH